MLLILKETLGVPWQHSGLKICYCHCYGLGHSCGVGSIPDPGIHAWAKKKKETLAPSVVKVIWLSYLKILIVQIKADHSGQAERESIM